VSVGPCGAWVDGIGVRLGLGKIGVMLGLGVRVGTVPSWPCGCAQADGPARFAARMKANTINKP
jgi:hypothetical protein